MYKLSKYNYNVQHGDKIVYFNGMTGRCFSVTEKEHINLSALFNDLVLFHIKYESLFMKFKEWGFIIDEHTDELDAIKFRNRQQVFLNKFYRLIINPTEDCVFNCWYCVQHTQNVGRMSDETIERVKKHLDFMVEKERITGLNLDWFGGEPLMYFNEVVYPLAMYAFEKIDKYQLDYFHHATTNAYLINEEMVKKMKEINLNSFQITLDGDEKRHNQIRNVKGKPSFRKIMDNIQLLCENLPHSHITLRLNYDNKTLTTSNMVDVFDQIPQEYRNKITLNFQRVWQTIQPGTMENNEAIIELHKKTLALGYSAPLSNAFGLHGAIKCYADRYFHSVINYNGKIYKCTANMQKEDGILHEDGHIEWFYDTLCKMYANATFENEQCLACKHLPICLGACVQKTKNKPDKYPCMLDITEVSPDRFIIETYENNLKSIKKEKQLA